MQQNIDRNCSSFAVKTTRLFLFIVNDIFGFITSLHERSLKSKFKRDTNEYKEFDRHMATGKISNAIRCLTDECKGGTLSIDDTVTKDGITKTVYDVNPIPTDLRKDPIYSKVNKYIFSLTLICFRR